MITTQALILALAACCGGIAAGWLLSRMRRDAGFTRYTDPVAAYRSLVQALNEMGEGLMIIENERFTFVNDALCRLSGYSREELLAFPNFSPLLHGQEQHRVLVNHRRRLAGEQFATRYETALGHKDGTAILVEISIAVLESEQRRAAVVAIRDIRDRRAAEDELRLHRDRLQEMVELRTAELALEKERAQVTLASIADAVVTTDRQGRVSYLSPAAEQLLGQNHELARGEPLTTVAPLRDEQSDQPLGDLVETCLAQGRLQDLTCLLVPGERKVPVKVSAAAVHDLSGQVIGCVIVLHDISEQRRLTQHLTHQATHDALTGLVNRYEFEQRLARLVEDARASGRPHAACYLDLDQFKLVNDTGGHPAGDELLRQLSRSLAGRMRRSDTLARLGGDEFGVLLDGCPEDQAIRIAHGLLDAVREFQLYWNGRRFGVGVSIGVVAITADTRDVDEVQRAADAACYEAKEKGRNRIQVHRHDDRELARRQGEIQWIDRLRNGLREDRFELHAQPIAPLAGAALPQQWEVLLRLREDDGRLVPPGAFLSTAERYKLMPEIDRWVIRHALAWYAELATDAPSPPMIAINLSGASLTDPALASYVEAALNGFAVAPERVCFELAEAAAVANLAETRRLIEQIRQLGCKFALDDFGIGMSSFAYLKNLPVDFIKIDGGFVRSMLTDPVDEATVDAINRLAHVLGIRTVAEHVESPLIRARLGQLGVDFGQGFGIARPRPLSELTLPMTDSVTP